MATARGFLNKLYHYRFLLFFALGGMAYQNYQKAVAAQRELANAHRRTQELQSKAEAADQLKE